MWADDQFEKLTRYGNHRSKQDLGLVASELVRKTSTTNIETIVAPTGPWMEPMVEARVMHSVGTGGFPPANCQTQVYRKSVRPRTGRYLFGAFYKTIWRKNMDTTTLLIIIVVLLLLSGGWYGRGRWYSLSIPISAQQVIGEA